MGVYQMKLTLEFQEFSSYPASSERDLWIQHKAQIPLDEDSNFLDAQLSLSTGSPGILRLARHWLTQCEGNHVACCTSTTRPHALPTRLIDVEVRTSSDVRLHVVDQNDSGIRYLTLSHCWGGLDVLTLRAENMSQLIAGFHMKDLPKTFEDAVEITRRLGFRYLWIDALCIIQDPAADWEKEASRMASIYENSACTIGALFGANSHAGCFKSRQPLEHFSCRISQKGSNAVFITSKHVFWELINENGTGPGQPGPLNTRAWVVQERMMSPRTLYFSSRRIH
jgi:Heterokaryon incompatibility protein (HET)